MIEWLIDNWLQVAIPLSVLIAISIIGFGLKRLAGKAFGRWTARTRWEGSQLVAATLRRPFSLWLLLLGVSVAVQVSLLPPMVKSGTSKIAGSLFVLSAMWVVIVISEQLLRIYLRRMKASHATIPLITNIVRIAVIVVGALSVLEIWGMPTSPFLLLIATAVLVSVLALRNAAPNVFAGFQLITNQPIRSGDYIKLESGEQGYVTGIGWSNTSIEALDGSTVIVPNGRLLQHTVVNYGRSLKKAKEPFHFQSLTHLTEITGLKAKNLKELVELLKKAPDSAIYYHTHRFLEEHQYLTPGSSNDFALWVSDALGNEVLGERLASIDTFWFPNLGALRGRLVGVIEECIADRSDSREAEPGREFHLMKSVTVVLPTGYVVHDLRELVETLRKVSLGSLFFHIFESRFRLGRGLNDFSIWLQDSLGEAELGEAIARLDPYTYTLEGLRSALIQLIDRRIQQA
jgi:small-conductance mechanosensitive channel